MGDYIQKMRAKIGQDRFIHPAARIIIENEQGQILVIERIDNGQIGLPAGAFEEGETITECIQREVFEETGLIVKDVEVIGISTAPTIETAHYPNGDSVQYFTVEFYTHTWEGDIKVQDTAEVKGAKFVDRELCEKLPVNERSTFESLDFFKKHHRVCVK